MFFLIKKLFYRILLFTTKSTSDVAESLNLLQCIKIDEILTSKKKLVTPSIYIKYYSFIYFALYIINVTK